MDRIILIETSTALCSTALAEDGKIVSKRESTTPRAHASLTALFVQEMLDERGIGVADCDAVCVSAGPGSYTGLRVGSSTAKGLCFGAGKPLIAVGTLEVLTAQAVCDGLIKPIDGGSAPITTPDNSCDGLIKPIDYIIPMIDARRMEVYSAVFTPDGERLTEVEPTVVQEDSFKEWLEKGNVLFIGDGALKCKDVIKSPRASFVQCCPRADAMLRPAMKEYKEKRFKDTAYFEPFYLKQFVATVSAKKLF